MWWMAMINKGKEKKAQGKEYLSARSAKNKGSYEPDQGLALSMPRATTAVDQDFSDEERRKKRLKASY